MRAIGPLLSDDERSTFIAHARALRGVRFRHQGRTDFALDCAGLPGLALQRTGRAFVDLAAYSRNPHMDGLRSMIEENLGPPVAEGPGADRFAQAGDVVLTNQDGGPDRHIAIVVDHPFFGLGLLHTCARFKKVIEHGLDPEWRARIVAVFRP